MMWHYYGQMWIWMFSTMLFGWAFVIALVVLVIRWLQMPAPDNKDPRKS